MKFHEVVNKAYYEKGQFRRPNDPCWLEVDEDGRILPEKDYLAYGAISFTIDDLNANDYIFKTVNNEIDYYPVIDASHEKYIEGYHKWRKTASQSNIKILNKCKHNWATYRGIQEEFEYCTICDKRK